MMKTFYLTVSQSRLLRSWVNTHLGCLLFASERLVGQLWNNYVLPRFRTWTNEDDDDKIEFWDKPPDLLILHCLSEYVNSYGCIQSIAKVDFLLSGDHGADSCLKNNHH